MDPDGVVAFFPSDHHFGDDEAFAAHIEVAFRQAESDSQRVILLGITPEAPEEAYGWIEPGPALAGSAGGSIFEVRRFWEKPSRNVASHLMRLGCLWNSFVMVGHVRTFLNLVRQTLPSLLICLESMWDAVVPGREHEALLDLYSWIPATSFSEDVLSVSPAALAVLRAGALGWSDLGEPQRVYSVLRFRGVAEDRESEWLGRSLEIPA